MNLGNGSEMEARSPVTEFDCKTRRFAPNSRVFSSNGDRGRVCSGFRVLDFCRRFPNFVMMLAAFFGRCFNVISRQRADGGVLCPLLCNERWAIQPYTALGRRGRTGAVGEPRLEDVIGFADASQA